MSSTPPQGSAVAIYARYSTVHQDERSIAGQFELCRRYSDRHSWNVVGEFSDEARSGTTLYGRRGIFDLLAACEAGRIQVVLTEDLDRLSRDAADMHGLSKTLNELDITLCTVSQGPVSDLQVAFSAIQNQQYVKQIVEKSKRGCEHTINSGRISGSLTYGHRKVLKFDSRGKPVNGLREIDPSHAAIVLRIFVEYDAGISANETCRRLNAEGIRSPRGTTWGPSSLIGSGPIASGILRNRFYTGVFVWRRTTTKKRNGKVKMSATPEETRIAYEHPHLKIIDQDLFDRVQARLERGGKAPFREMRMPDYLFSGKYRCGVCGEPVVIMNKRLGCIGNNRKGVCEFSRRVPREDVEDAILTKISTYVVGSPHLDLAISAFRAEVERAATEHADAAGAAGTELPRLEQRRANLVRQLGDDEDPFLADALKAEIRSLGVRIKQLQHTLSVTLQVPVAALDLAVVQARLRSTLSELRVALDGEDREATRARELVRGLIEKIVISPDLSTPVDGRGAGAVLVTVHGRVPELLGLAEVRLDRHIQSNPRLKVGLGGTIGVFKLHFSLPYLNPRLAQTFADLPIMARLLDQAAVPVIHATFAEALATEGSVLNPAETKDAAERLRYALDFLSKRGLAHAIRSGPKTTGWVWNNTGINDAVWKARALGEASGPAPPHSPRPLFADPVALS